MFFFLLYKIVFSYVYYSENIKKMARFRSSKYLGSAASRRINRSAKRAVAGKRSSNAGQKSAKLASGKDKFIKSGVVRWGGYADLTRKGPFPFALFTKLKYASTVNLSAGVGGVTQAPWIFKLNGLFDPDTTGVGHQPYGFDQFFPIYSHYTCFGASVQITVTSASSPTAALVWTILPGANTSNDFTGRDITAFSERPGSGYSTKSSDDNAVVNLGYLNHATIEGVSKSKIMDDYNYSAVVTTDPVSNQRLLLGCCDTLITSEVSITLLVEIIYHVRFWRRNQMPQS